VKKCVVLHYGNHNPNAVYYLDGTALPVASSTRDLGIMLTNTGTFREHSEYVTAKARRLTGMMLRTFQSRDRNVLLPVYKSLIRPVLEYATVIWSPYHKCDIKEVESVQRYFTKRIHGLGHLPYADRLSCLQLSTLENRRLYFDLLMCHKLLHGLLDCHCRDQLHLRHSNTRGHAYTLIPCTSTLDVRFHFFSERVVNSWNSLPSDIVDVADHDRFKRVLRQYLRAH